MKITEGIREDKKQHLERLLERGTVMVFVDARKTDVHVPPQHRGNPQLALNFDYAFQVPDFRVLEDCVEGSLSFNRAPFFCRIPFSAIYAMRCDFADEMVFFMEDAPKDIRKTPQPEKETRQESPGKPQLKDVSLSNHEKEPENRDEGKPAEKKKRGSHLRVIK